MAVSDGPHEPRRLGHRLAGSRCRLARASRGTSDDDGSEDNLSASAGARRRRCSPLTEGQVRWQPLMKMARSPKQALAFLVLALLTRPVQGAEIGRWTEEAARGYTMRVEPQNAISSTRARLPPELGTHLSSHFNMDLTTCAAQCSNTEGCDSAS